MKPANQGCVRSMIAMMLLCVIGCVPVDWTSLLSRDHTQVDPAPPITRPQFRLLIVEETADRPSLSADQLSIFTSTAVRDYFDQHCMKLADGTNGYRIVDKDDIANLPADFQATVKPGNPTPWLYCTDGTKGLSCPLPASVSDLLAKVRPYAEGK